MHDWPGRVPDLALLYGHPDCILSPRMAFRLWRTALLLQATYGDEGMSESLLPELPPIARRLADDAWLARFIRCFGSLAERIGRGGFDPSETASCTGDEMALHLVIDEAEEEAHCGEIQIPEYLPSDPERDDDFELVREIMFRDHDVLLLFEGSLDGIEDGESEMNEFYRFANLHPREWFLPFADVEPRDEPTDRQR